MWAIRASLIGCTALCIAIGGFAEVTISPGEGDTAFSVRTPLYQAVVASDGCLTSLSVGGAEFLAGKKGISRGAYLYDKGTLKLPDVRQEAGDVITAGSEKALARYRFAEDALTWRFTNKADTRLLFIIVLDPAVNAVMNERGTYYRAPVERPWAASTWFRDGAKLRIEGGTRLWGPWAGDHQVFQLDIEPKATREVTLQPAMASQEESNKAVEAAAKIPEPPKDPEGPMWDLNALSEPPQTYPADEFREEGVQALFYDGLPFEGQPTRVFAWLGMPKVEPGTKVPGMVLVHGGGGTAFAEWVKLWTGRGYAAIAMDTCGCVPGGDHGKRPRHEHGGPGGWGGLGQIDWPREDQWTYHAVADVLLAHSLLRSLPQVDPERTGVTGISWGGYLTSIIAGVDKRFKLAVPVYGCGYYLDTVFGAGVKGLGDERAARWMRWWDPSVYLKDAAMPMLWVTGSNDFAYWFPALQKSYRATAGSHALTIRLRMPHGHGGAGENPEEIRAFADSILKGAPPMLRVTGQGREGDQVWATFEGAVPAAAAELNFTKDTGSWPERQWEALPAQIDQAGKVTATLPPGSMVYYINITDESGLLVSTEHVELDH